MSEFRFTGRDGTPIVGYQWPAATPSPRAVVQVSHGVGDHLRRYEHLAQTLSAAGFVVRGHDSRGHGRTLTEGAEPGVIGPEGWTRTVEDLGVAIEGSRAAHPGLPLVLLAHSMGSYAIQQWLPEHSGEIDALALTGTTAPDLLEPHLDLDGGVRLEDLNAPFAPGRTGFEWLSRDEEQVDRYVADPLTGFGYDTEGMKAVFAGARRAAEPERLAGLRADLPVYLAVGDQDPTTGQGMLTQALAARYRDAGVTDVEVHVYPDARHEVLNETNRDEVEKDILSWLDRVVPR